MNDPEVALITEQLARMRDNIEARFERLEAAALHRSNLDAEHWQANRRELDTLHKMLQDHEQRLRDVSDGVTSYRTWITLTSGGSALAAIVAFIKAFFGG